MANLETSYLGIKLNSPVIAGSCGLTNSVENIKEIEKNGAGAVVLKSIFEEQINIETQKLLKADQGSIQGWKSTFENIIGQNDYHYEEAMQYIQSHAQEHTLSNYLKFVESAKKATRIPIIASINCVSNYEWLYFAKKIQDTGIDAIELNIFILPSNLDSDADEIEKKYLDIIEQVKKYITIPLGKNRILLHGSRCHGKKNIRNRNFRGCSF
jgi:dihydroorotate dehydrogenase (fumarate)